MKVVLAVKSLFPSYGGPAFSVSRLALALADAGVEGRTLGHRQVRSRIAATAEASLRAPDDRLDCRGDKSIWRA